MRLARAVWTWKLAVYWRGGEWRQDESGCPDALVLVARCRPLGVA